MPNKVSDSVAGGEAETEKGEAHTFKIWIDYDPEVDRWYVCDSELYGLGLEDSDPARLIQRLRIAAPDLIELNREFEGADRVFMLPVFRNGIEIERVKPVGESTRHGDAIVEMFREIGLTDEEHKTIFGGSDARR